MDSLISTRTIRSKIVKTQDDGRSSKKYVLRYFRTTPPVLSSLLLLTPYISRVEKINHSMVFRFFVLEENRKYSGCFPNKSFCFIQCVVNIRFLVNYIKLFEYYQLLVLTTLSVDCLISKKASLFLT